MSSLITRRFLKLQHPEWGQFHIALPGHIGRAATVKHALYSVHVHAPFQIIPPPSPTIHTKTTPSPPTTPAQHDQGPQQPQQPS